MGKSDECDGRMNSPGSQTGLRTHSECPGAGRDWGHGPGPSGSQCYRQPADPEDNWPTPGAAPMPAGLCLVKMGTLVGLGAGIPEASDSFQSGPGSVLKAERTDGQEH